WRARGPRRLPPGAPSVVRGLAEERAPLVRLGARGGQRQARRRTPRSTAAPTAKQLAWAQLLEEATGMSLPQSNYESSRGLERDCDLLIAVTPVPPSEALLQKAERLATRDRVELPDRARRSKNVCARFIKERSRKRGSLPPTDNQILLARRLLLEVSGEDHQDVPEDVLNDESSCSKFIDDMMKQRDDEELQFRPPLYRVNKAKELAERAGEEVPKDVLEDELELDGFIRDLEAKLGESVPAHQKRIEEQAPPKPPGQAQLKVAEALANKHGLEVPEEARMSTKACVQFIADHMPKPRR
ncbi:unnamed protein product, partial [Prorocentrum cordatum]